ncbi:UDP-N-acetylmuramoyl-L-alanyl-D-glutamate--2,6-diaminopimelate ligase [Sulfobacillus thermosulfidooxidans]|uniref:UDP-N-acetylmuramoyl-L-alanyl-D-glutamate--2, 6-diaminopimelate ligase n=1 Tax=Sulfobacillus thermosulfidooxidans TaxID=28034 RepID=UPI0002F8CD89|nr:UDP-N-acetylmuramoyl-L-alanyl-D-glutamate--2,6-diaminopimelate ligase [Sulfobacillus thermosulfidooxidans]
MDQQLSITESGWVFGPAVKGIRMDSRLVQPGDVFIAVSGSLLDGHEFIQQAIDKGAVAIVGEKPMGTLPVPYIQVQSSREAAADIATSFYRHPSKDLVTVAVTGTNGKTSVVYWLSAILNAANIKTGLVSSVVNDIVCRKQPASLTTPESPDLQAYLDQIRNCGGKAAVVEVSSHGIVQQRVRGTIFQLAILTNITREHLDFHGTMERYVDAKATLFRMLPPNSLGAVLNADDQHFETVAKASRAPVTSYGIKAGDIRGQVLQETAWSTDIRVSGLNLDFITRVNHPGRYNVYNVLAVTAAAIRLGVTQEVLQREIPNLPSVPGRMQITGGQRGPMAVVDYAHTPDGLYQSLLTVRKFTEGKVWLIFGARGGRDRGKRPEMGRIAAQYADYVIVTADSPNLEDPQKIADALIEGIRQVDDTKLKLVELNRALAIHYAVRHAEKNDVILITGRGPETIQHFGNEDVRLVDAEVVEEALQERWRQEGSHVPGIS